MAQSYSIFDAESVQARTRQDVTQLAIPCVLSLGGSLGLFALWTSGVLPATLTLFVLVAMWSVVFAWVIRRRHRLKSVMWCVKISGDDVVGYDYARRRTRFSWDEVIRLEITDSNINLINNKAERMTIPALFDQFTELSHLLVAHGERHGVEIYIDGRPFHEVEIYELFPFLTNDTHGPSAPRSSARW